MITTEFRDSRNSRRIRTNRPSVSLAHLAGVGIRASDLGLTDKNAVVKITTGADVDFEASLHVGVLNIIGDGKAKLVPGAAKLLFANDLTIAPGGKLDLADNDMIIQTADPAARDAMVNVITALIRRARDKNAEGKLWQGTGITTSAASPLITGLTGLAVVANVKQVPNPNGPGMIDVPLTDTFSGLSVDMNCVLVTYTCNGDMNVNGVIDADDYYQIDTGFLAFFRSGGKTSYRWGDIDFNDHVNADDYYLVDSAFLQQKGVVMSAHAPAGGSAAPASGTAKAGVFHTAMRKGLAKVLHANRGRKR